MLRPRGAKLNWHFRWWALLFSAALVAGVVANRHFGTDPCAPLDAPCDVRDGDCQERILRRVACFDEVVTNPELPDVRVEDGDSLDEAREARIPGARAEGISLRDRGLGVLGLLEERESASEGIRRAMRDSRAHYDWPRRTLHVWPGEASDSVEGVSLLAHELFHSIQHQRWERPLTQGMASTDAYFTALARMEGEATWVQWRMERELRGEGAPDAGERSLFLRQLLMDADEAVRAGGSTLPLAMRHYPYALGARLFGLAEVGPTPRHAVDLLSRRGAERAALDRPPGRLLADEATSDQLGAIALCTLLGGHGVPRSDAWRLASDWRGDRFEVERVGEGDEVRVSWAIRTGGGASAAEIASALEDMPGLEVSATDGVVSIETRGDEETTAR